MKNDLSARTDLVKSEKIIIKPDAPNHARYLTSAEFANACEPRPLTLKTIDEALRNVLGEDVFEALESDGRVAQLDMAVRRCFVFCAGDVWAQDVIRRASRLLSEWGWLYNVPDE